MTKKLTLIDPNPLPATSNPARMPSLPAWLQRRADALANVVQPDSTGRYRETAVLPPALILSSSERRAVEEHIAALTSLLGLDQPIMLREKVLTNDEAHAFMIGKLLMKGGGQKLDQNAADAAAEDYFDAIEDLPAWAVREAIRKWNRGESPRLDDRPHNFSFRPEPAHLRRLSQFELSPIKARILKLKMLLDAGPLIEYSDEHRARMLDRLQVLMHSVAEKVSAAPSSVAPVPAIIEVEEV